MPLCCLNNSRLFFSRTVSFLAILLLAACSRTKEDQPASLDSIPEPAKVSASGNGARVIVNNKDQDTYSTNTDQKPLDTCTVDVFISPSDFTTDPKSVKQKLILQYEYCKVHFTPEVRIEDDGESGRSIYRQIWPPIMIKARLFASRAAKIPYRTILYNVQKDKEEYLIEDLSNNGNRKARKRTEN